jgi:hypothetical protein
MLAHEPGHHAQVFDARVILHDGAGIEDVTAVARHTVEDLATMLSHFFGFAIAEQHVGNAAAEREFVVQFAVRQKEAPAIHMEQDAAFGQFEKIVEVMVPVALGIEQRLVAVFPELLDARLERGPVVRFELCRVDERHAATVHPEADRHLVRLLVA